ncbi:helix-turn-helix domain-containing protein [Plantactinospora siamensis]|uniref:Helix-turn-helix domain-containing protein n=1 Tax=Plantactinospora siamensis TaxID=555372 RepID=A0ABV6P086_9ACTN
MEAVTGTPTSALRGMVDRYLGYRESLADEVIRDEVAGAYVVLILGWGDPMDVANPRAPGSGVTAVPSFVAGVFDSVARTRLHGTGEAVQLILDPLVAGRILGLPAGELANRAVRLDDLPGRWLPALAERLAGADGWPARFGLLERALTDRLAATPAPDPRLAHALRRLTRDDPRPAIGALADEIGWSRRHLAAMLRREVGASPVTVARLARFHRAYRLAGGELPGGWAGVAAACGYFDQAHLIREFHEFAGAAPAALLRSGAIAPPG